MFRHYCVIYRELVVSTSLSYVGPVCMYEYIPGSINIQIVYTATIQDFLRIVTTKTIQPFYYN